MKTQENYPGTGKPWKTGLAEAIINWSGNLVIIYYDSLLAHFCSCKIRRKYWSNSCRVCRTCSAGTVSFDSTVASEHASRIVKDFDATYCVITWCGRLQERWMDTTVGHVIHRVFLIAKHERGQWMSKTALKRKETSLVDNWVLRVGMTLGHWTKLPGREVWGRPALIMLENLLIILWEFPPKVIHYSCNLKWLRIAGSITEFISIFWVDYDEFHAYMLALRIWGSF